MGLIAHLKVRGGVMLSVNLFLKPILGRAGQVACILLE